MTMKKIKLSITEDPNCFNDLIGQPPKLEPFCGVVFDLEPARRILQSLKDEAVSQEGGEGEGSPVTKNKLNSLKIKKI